MNNPAESAIINNNVNGILANSPSDFVEKILDISSDIHYLRKIGSAAHNEILSKIQFETYQMNFMLYLNPLILQILLF